MTGLAQVNGRNNIAWEDKFNYDLEYISNISFLYDLRILFKTIEKVIKRKDINREGTASDLDFGDWLLNNGKISQEEYSQKQKEACKILEKNI